MAHKVFFVIGRGKLLLGVGRRQQQGRASLSSPPPWLLLSVTGDIRMCQLIRVQAKKKRVAWKSVRSIQTWKRRLEEWVSALERSGCCLINSDASIFSRRSFALGTRRGKIISFFFFVSSWMKKKRLDSCCPRWNRFISFHIYVKWQFISRFFLHRDRVIRINLHNVSDTNCEVSHNSRFSHLQNRELLICDGTGR